MDEADQLYALPPEQFVDEREQLARRLRSEGDRDGAKRVKALRKPTVAAWAVNQAVRRDADRVRELLEAGEALRAAHEGLLAGGDRAALRDAGERERALVSKLTEVAVGIASAGGGGEAARERIRSTFHAAALDEELRAELASGRVTREREAVGLGGFGGVEAFAAPAGPPERKPSKAGAQPARKDSVGAGRAARAGGRKRAESAADTPAPRTSKSAARAGKRKSSESAAATPERRTSRSAARADGRKGRESAARAREQEREREQRDRVQELERELAVARDEEGAREAAVEQAAGEVSAARERAEAARAALKQAEQAEKEALKGAREADREVRRLERLLERARG